VPKVEISEASLITTDPNVVSCDLADGVALLDLRSSTYYSTNPVGAYVWTLLSEPQPVSRICDAVSDQYEVDAAQCLRDVTALLQGLAEADLVKVSDAPSS